MTTLSEHNRNLLNKLKELNLPRGHYIIFGSGAMMIRGLKDGNDLDVFVSQELFDQYKNVEGWKLKQGDKDFCLSNEEIELWKTWKPGEWNFEEVVRNAEYIEGLPFVDLETTRKWKLMNGREKDLEHVKIIDSYLENKSK